MSVNSDDVFGFWLRLTAAEQEEFIKQVQNYNSASGEKKKEIRESILKIQTGPMAGTCPRCGK